MLKPSLQLRMGQQLTMTPQLQQAIRLLQMPALELQAHIRELLESNVMLEPVEDADTTSGFEAVEPPVAEPEVTQAAASDQEPQVEVVDDHWGEQSVGPAENSWNGDDDDRQQEFADASGETVQEHLLWQLEMARLAPRALGIASAIVDAINDDGYLMEPLEEIASTLRPEIQADVAEIEAVLRRVQLLDPPGVGARSVSECIELQLRQIDPDTPGLATAVAIARHHLQLVAGREMSLLRRELKATDEEIASALVLVRACHPRRAPPSAVARLNTWCRMFLCVAPITVAGRWRSMRLPSQGCASITVTPASLAAAPATPACARSCRKRAGCSRVSRSATRRS